MIAAFAVFVGLTVAVVIYSIREPLSSIPRCYFAFVLFVDVTIAVIIHAVMKPIVEYVQRSLDLDPGISARRPVEEGYSHYVRVSVSIELDSASQPWSRCRQIIIDHPRTQPPLIGVEAVKPLDH